MMLVRQPHQITKEVAIMDDKNTLAHTSWRCKYHIVFAPKYRRKEIYGKYRVEIGKMIRILCQRKDINIVEAELCPDHIHIYACRNTAKVFCIADCRIFEREKLPYDIR